MTICTCVGHCRGREGLGEGWVCALDEFSSRALAKLERQQGAVMAHPDFEALLRNIVENWDHDNQEAFTAAIGVARQVLAAQFLPIQQ